MKIRSAIAAFILASVPAFAADWAPRLEFSAAEAAAVPEAGFPLRAGPRDGENYSGAEELLIKEFGVARVSMDIPEDEVMRQDRFYQNAFCFEHALRLALNAVLGDYSEPTSPLARELSKMGALEKPGKNDLKVARQRVLSVLDREESFVALVRPYKFYQPAGGEGVDQNWLIFFRLGGRHYWAVVDRAGEKAPYVYGTN